MPELFTVLPPHAALQKLFDHIASAVPTETIETPLALNRVLAEAPVARSPLPAFPRSTMDGYAVRASDTYGASEAIPAYLTVIGESPMGSAPTRSVNRGETMIYSHRRHAARRRGCRRDDRAHAENHRARDRSDARGRAR